MQLLTKIHHTCEQNCKRAPLSLTPPHTVSGGIFPSDSGTHFRCSISRESSKERRRNTTSAMPQHNIGVFGGKKLVTSGLMARLNFSLAWPDQFTRQALIDYSYYSQNFAGHIKLKSIDDNNITFIE